MNKPFTKNSFLLLPISLMLIIGLTLVSCGSSPQNVIKQWHTAVEKGNDSAINNLIVPGSNLSRSMLAGGLHRETFLKAVRGRVVMSMTEYIEGNIANVDVNYNAGGPIYFRLAKVDGKWLISGFQY